MNKIVERIKNEPAVLITALAAVAALFGVDAVNFEEQYEPIIQLALLLSGAGAVRGLVRPERKVPSYVDPVETEHGMV